MRAAPLVLAVVLLAVAIARATRPDAPGDEPVAAPVDAEAREEATELDAPPGRPDTRAERADRAGGPAAHAVPDDRAPTAPLRLRGRLVEANGAPVGDLGVVLRLGADERVAPVGPDGVFDAGPAPPSAESAPLLFVATAWPDARVERFRRPDAELAPAPADGPPPEVVVELGPRIQIPDALPPGVEPTDVRAFLAAAHSPLSSQLGQMGGSGRFRERGGCLEARVPPITNTVRGRGGTVWCGTEDGLWRSETIELDDRERVENDVLLEVEPVFGRSCVLVVELDEPPDGRAVLQLTHPPARGVESYALGHDVELDTRERAFRLRWLRPHSPVARVVWGPERSTERGRVALTPGQVTRVRLGMR